MILEIFLVRDGGAVTYGNPICFPTTGAAIRQFGDMVNTPDKDSLIYRHPEDFDLFRCGTFDTNDGSFVVRPPEQVARGRDLKVKE